MAWGRRDQRGVGKVPTGVTHPKGTADARVPGNRDLVQQPGHDMEDNQSARFAGEAVSGQWGGTPSNSSPQVGSRKP